MGFWTYTYACIKKKAPAHESMKAWTMTAGNLSYSPCLMVHS